MMWIYFAMIDKQGISIGSTRSLERRMKQHARTKHALHEVDFLAAVEGTAACEKIVQRYFADDAVEGFRPDNGSAPEYFKCTPRLTNYIRWLRNQWFVIIKPDDEVEGSVDFGVWEPAENRQVEPPSDPLFPPDYLEFGNRIVTGDDYYTNQAVLERVRQVLGKIELDPASHAMANKLVRAERFFTIHENGLEQQWSGNVWLNPPFSQWKEWVPKIIKEFRSGRIPGMIVYSAMRTVTAKYFRRLLDEADAMCIITGRLRHGGKGTDAPDDGHCVLLLGGDANKFGSAFEDLGSIWINNNIGDEVKCLESRLTMDK